MLYIQKIKKTMHKYKKILPKTMKEYNLLLTLLI
jgi:hypothetical protein